MWARARARTGVEEEGAREGGSGADQHIKLGDRDEGNIQLRGRERTAHAEAVGLWRRRPQRLVCDEMRARRSRCEYVRDCRVDEGCRNCTGWDAFASPL